MLRGFTKWSALAKPVMRHRQWARNFSYVPEKVRNVAIIAHVDHGNDHCYQHSMCIVLRLVMCEQ